MRPVIGGVALLLEEEFSSKGLNPAALSAFESRRDDLVSFKEE